MVRLNTPEATRLPGSASPPPPTEQPSRKGQPGPACCRCGSAAGMCRAPRRSSPGPRGSRPPPRAAATPLPRFTFLRDGGVRGAQWRTRSTQQATCHTKHAATGIQCPFFFASHRSPPPPRVAGWLGPRWEGPINNSNGPCASSTFHTAMRWAGKNRNCYCGEFDGDKGRGTRNTAWQLFFLQKTFGQLTLHLRGQEPTTSNGEGWAHGHWQGPVLGVSCEERNNL